MSEVTFDVKLIKQNTRGVNQPDDPSYPFVLDMLCRSPSFMEVAQAFLFGGREEVRVRGKTKEAIVGFARHNNLARHPRLTKLTIVEEVDGKPNLLFEVCPNENKPAPPELLKA